MKSGFKLCVGILLAVIVSGIVMTLFQSVLGYVILFLAAIGVIALVRQIILGVSKGGRIETESPSKSTSKNKAEAQAHRELKQLEKRLRR